MEHKIQIKKLNNNDLIKIEKNISKDNNYTISKSNTYSIIHIFNKKF